MEKQEAKTIAVLGAGAWGTALALVLAHNHHTVYLWEFDPTHYQKLKETRISDYLPSQRLPENLIPFCDLSLAVKEVQAILIVVPSHVFQNTLINLKKISDKPVPIAWATKGLIPPDRLAHEIFHEVFGKGVPCTVLTGPTFAKEVAERLPTSLLAASADIASAMLWRDKLTNDYFHVDICQDMIGAQIAGVVKNVLAIAIGMSDGLGYGANTRCALITRGLNEMICLGEAMGAKQDTFLSVAGIGDLILTCTDNQSRNRRFGLALGQGQTVEEALKTVGLLVEGYHNTKSLYQLISRHHLTLPVLEKIHEVLIQQKSAALAIKSLW
ncbi:MAG: glycerol-3-phosphate dehydrogenase [Gammaproteobacteria bacterium RIFCSPHIGHO2_12_38_15]|nr:MAG: glycerol-3-phosphate dehydrogenase [Gammaproteobacteria bacterium RIFCSPHIGHO2_12_38_15]